MTAIPPVPDQTDQYFWNGVGEHRLLIQRCTGCATLRLPPVPMCGVCHALTWDTVEAVGRGTIYSWLLSRPPGDSAESARVVILVQLAEGPRVVSNLVSADPDGSVDLSAIANDMPVQLCFREIDGVLLPLFHAVSR